MRWPDCTHPLRHRSHAPGFLRSFSYNRWLSHSHHRSADIDSILNTPRARARKRGKSTPHSLNQSGRQCRVVGKYWLDQEPEELFLTRALPFTRCHVTCWSPDKWPYSSNGDNNTCLDYFRGIFFVCLGFFKHLYWSIIALQWCVSFCCITKWISYTYTYIPISPPSCVSLPTSLSHPSRWSQSTELISLCYAVASH